jgi:hypothetical protein
MRFKMTRMQQKLAELQMESRLFDQEENTIQYGSDEDNVKPPSPTSNKLTKVEINRCKKL